MSEGAESCRVIPVYGKGGPGGHLGSDAAQGEPRSSLRFLTSDSD